MSRPTAAYQQGVKTAFGQFSMAGTGMPWMATAEGRRQDAALRAKLNQPLPPGLKEDMARFQRQSLSTVPASLWNKAASAQREKTARSGVGDALKSILGAPALLTSPEGTRPEKALAAGTFGAVVGGANTIPGGLMLAAYNKPKWLSIGLPLAGILGGSLGMGALLKEPSALEKLQTRMRG